MLRGVLLAASASAPLRRIAEEFGPARAVAMRFVAGETLDDALRAAHRLHAAGMAVSLDQLGEAVTDPAVARAAADDYLRALGRLATSALDGQISVKASQLGLRVAPSRCRDLLSEVCDRAAAHGTDVTVDMEGSDLTQATVDLVVSLRSLGHGNVGCAVQSYLYRTPDDVAKLTASGASLRLCKGAYAEPPAVAFQRAADIDAAYARLAARLLRSGTYPRIATHDHRLIRRVADLARREGIDGDRFEFQMLYGVRQPLQRQLVADGWRLRIYVPFGSDWYPYFMRRIAERPANLAFFLRAVAGRRA